MNEASRIAAMCRSVDQPVLISSAFADVRNVRTDFIGGTISPLRGVARPPGAITLDTYRQRELWKTN